MADSPDPFTSLDRKLEQILLAQANFSNTLMDIDNRTSHLENQLSLNPKPLNTPYRSMKMDLPPFDGTDSLGWIFKANQFFAFHQTPLEQRIQLASFSLEGKALSWFQWMHNNGLLTSWDSFLRALELRFAPSKFDDPIATLCKLSQTHSLQDYLSEFEKLSNRISGYPTSFYLSCFISGLKPHLRREVTVLQPSDLNQAIAFAKLHEDKHSSNPPFNRFSRPSPSTNTPPLTPLFMFDTPSLEGPATDCNSVRPENFQDAVGLSTETWNLSHHQVQALPPLTVTVGLDTTNYLPPLIENVDNMVPIEVQRCPMDEQGDIALECLQRQGLNEWVETQQQCPNFLFWDSVEGHIGGEELATNVEANTLSPFPSSL